MRYVSAFHEGKPIAGRLVDDNIVPFSGITELGAATPLSVLCRPELDESRQIPLADVRLRAVVPNPRKIICVGSNYHAHVEEMGRDVPEYPILFPKFASALIGPYDPIARPPESKQVDYEGEVAVVIGEHARRIAKEDALSVVAGYAVVNDVSMRDYQYRTHQWLAGKVWDSSTPLGPALVTADEVDPANLDIELTLNGEVMQRSNTSLMIFDIATIISVVSEFVALEPGDVLLSGTPGGVGFKRDPQVFLEHGDRVVVEVAGLGRIENEVRAEDRA